MEKSAKFKKLAIVCVTEFLMMRISLKYLMSPIIQGISNVGITDPALSLIHLTLFLIPILICLLYMKFTCPEKLSVFVVGGGKNCLRGLIIGLAAGFFMNLILCLSSMVSGVSYSFVGFSPLLLAAILPNFIQCASEEVLLKGYAAGYLEDEYSEDVVIFATGILFVLHHIGNLKAYGFDSAFCLNVFLVGTVEYLLMKQTGSIWAAFGLHTAWNYTQSFIFGSENSGIESTLALFVSKGGEDSFFTNTVYGNEGTWFCTVLLVIALIILSRMRKKNESLKEETA